MLKLIPRAIIVCLILFPTIGGSSERPRVTDRVIAEGRALYAQNCSSCHGNAGRGDGPAALTLDPAPADFSAGKFKYGGKPEEIFKTLEEGIPNSMMVSYKYLSAVQRWSLVAYVESLKAK
jgi:high-affinity iron transporter